MREKLPDTRRSITHKAVILSEKDGKLDRVKFYFTIGFYPDGRPGELFMHMDEAGSTLDGMADSFGIMVSFSLQNGVTWSKLVEKLAYQQFNPQGMTENPKLRFVKSVVDYVMRWGELEFGGNAECRVREDAGPAIAGGGQTPDAEPEKT